MGSPSSFLRYKRLKTKERRFLHASFVVIVICFVILKGASCWVIIGVSFSTIRLPLGEVILQS